MYLRFCFITPRRCVIFVITLVTLFVFHFVVYKFRSDESGRTAETIDFHDIEHYQNDVLLTPQNYPAGNLREWVPAPVVREKIGIAGELGKAVVLSEYMEEIAKKRFKEHEFNIVVSEMISLKRSLQDERDPLCLKLKYSTRLPTTSVIIIFHNEAWSTLLRSVWSIINRSPKGLVKEIILVDDASTHEYLGEQLVQYVETLPIHTKVSRMEQRFGLIKARLRGAEIAQGEVLTFLDSHIECHEGWLEPLLSSIAENRRLVAIPMIDIIKDDTFEYVLANKDLWGGMDWKVSFKWIDIPPRERKRTGNSTVAALYTPTMAGGLFSIDREFFFEMGSYDEDMLIWGSENLEMSFRIWMCGGGMVILPCSRVGHVFRKLTPYTYTDLGVTHIVAYNSNRLVNVWLDNWSEMYYLINPGRQKTDPGDVSKRIALRKQLNCKSFQWYVDNIYPEMDMPRDSEYIGQIQSVEAQGCLVAYADKKEALLQICDRAFDNQVFVLTQREEIRCNGLCMDADSSNGSVKAWKCHKMGGNQKWKYNRESKTFRHNSGSCLQRDNHPSEPWVLVKPCDGSTAQEWLLVNRNYEPTTDL